MTRQPAIWKCVKTRLPHHQWTDLKEIYSLVEINLSLDDEDFKPQSPSSDIPKWMRNVRNVLQYRRKTGEIEWNGSGKYRI